MPARSWWSGPVDRPADFEQFLKALRREEPDRPVLFEFCINDTLAEIMLAERWPAARDLHWTLRQSLAMRRAGYDYLITTPSDFGFPVPARERARSVGMHGDGVVADRAGFDAYDWPDPDAFDPGRLDDAAALLPDGAGLVLFGCGGVLENALKLMGYEAMCMATMDDPQLLGDVFEAVGSRLVRYFRRAVDHPAVGAVFSTDDWGFKTQPMLSPDQIRRYVFPWHRGIVEAAHAAGVPAILHSCGNLETLMDGVIDELGYDGKHSYEDAILPVEDAWDRFGERIAIVGGIDVDFLCRESPEAVHDRCRALLEKTGSRGYILGTGNSVPEYIPHESYFAMVAAATGE